MADRQGARALALRATVSLARATRGTEAFDPARARLAALGKLLTEGADLADMTDAHSVLDDV